MPWMNDSPWCDEHVDRKAVLKLETGFGTATFCAKCAVSGGHLCPEQAKELERTGEVVEG